MRLDRRGKPPPQVGTAKPLELSPANFAANAQTAQLHVRAYLCGLIFRDANENSFIDSHLTKRNRVSKVAQTKIVNRKRQRRQILRFTIKVCGPVGYYFFAAGLGRFLP